MSNIIDGATSSNGVFRIEQSGGKSRETTDNSKEAGKIKGRQLLPEVYESNDQVIFIDSAKRLKDLERELREAPMVDKAKVEDIKRRIADGSLEINADNIASKLLEVDELLY